MFCADADQKSSYSEANTGSWEWVKPQGPSQMAASSCWFPPSPRRGPPFQLPPAHLMESSKHVLTMSQLQSLPECPWHNNCSSTQSTTHCSTQACSARAKLKHWKQEEPSFFLTGKSVWGTWLATESWMAWVPPSWLLCAQRTQPRVSCPRLSD